MTKPRPCSPASPDAPVAQELISFERSGEQSQDPLLGQVSQRGEVGSQVHYPFEGAERTRSPNVAETVHTGEPLEDDFDQPGASSKRAEASAWPSSCRTDSVAASRGPSAARSSQRSREATLRSRRIDLSDAKLPRD